MTLALARDLGRTITSACFPGILRASLKLQT